MTTNLSHPDSPPFMVTPPAHPVPFITPAYPWQSLTSSYRRFKKQKYSRRDSSLPSNSILLRKTASTSWRQRHRIHAPLTFSWQALHWLRSSMYPLLNTSPPVFLKTHPFLLQPILACSLLCPTLTHDAFRKLSLLNSNQFCFFSSPHPHRDTQSSSRSASVGPHLGLPLSK